MRALVFDSQAGDPPGLRLARDRAAPQPPQGEVRIRTILAGICNTDLEVVRGYAEIQGVLGHEFVGIVEQTEDSALVGRRVVGEISASCRVCPTCRAGRYTHCPTRTTLGIRNRDGVLADAFCLPVSNLHLVPDDLPDEVAVFTEPLAAACQILEQIQVKPTDRAIVLGDGKLGLLGAQVVALTGCGLDVSRCLACLACECQRYRLAGKHGRAPLSIVESGQSGQPHREFVSQNILRASPWSLHFNWFQHEGKMS